MILSNNYDHNASSFLAYLEKTRQNLEEEPIHQLRVHIKRMRAILELIEIVSQGKFSRKSHFALFSNLFRHAGNLREIQVNYSVLKELQYNNIESFKEHLKDLESKAGKKFSKAVDNFEPAEFKKINGQIRPVVMAMDDEKIVAQSEKFVSREIRKIKKLRHKLSDPHYLHKIRILLKSMSAILKLLDEYGSDAQPVKLKKEIKPLESLIGDWHDKQVLVKCMKRFIAKSKNNDPEIRHLKTLVSQIGKDNRRVVRVIGKKLSTLWPSK